MIEGRVRRVERWVGRLGLRVRGVTRWCRPVGGRCWSDAETRDRGTSGVTQRDVGHVGGMQCRNGRVRLLRQRRRRQGWRRDSLLGSYCTRVRRQWTRYLKAKDIVIPVFLAGFFYYYTLRENYQTIGSLIL